MEVQRPPRLQQPDPRLLISKTSPFSRLLELFKGIKVPQNEPVPLRDYPKTKEAQIFIEGHKALELHGKHYALPTMSIAQEQLHIWESQIRDRLQDELTQCIRTESCHLELYMVCDRKRRIGPCIVLTCWNANTCSTERGREITRRKVQKRIPSLQSLQNCPFPCKVVVDELSLFARLSGPAIDPGIRVRANLTKHALTFVSLLIVDEDRAFSECTLGGLICVDGKVYGLTVAHAFSSRLESISSETDARSESSETQDADSDDSDDSLFNGFDCYQIGDTVTIQIENDHTNLERHRTGNPQNILAMRDHESRGKRPRLLKFDSSVEIGRICSTSSTHMSVGNGMPESDWALIELEKSIGQPRNFYHIPQSTENTLIERLWLHSLEPNTQVVVLGGRTGTSHGIIGQSNIKLSIQGRDLVVTQIVLREPLESGDSGSWVMKDQSVVGYIVAGRRFLPIAYMIPMTRAFEEISQRFGGVNVGIPGVQVELSSSERSASSGSGRVLQSGFVSVGESSTALLAPTDVQPLPGSFQTSLERDSVTSKTLNVGTDTSFVADGRISTDEENAIRKSNPKLNGFENVVAQRVEPEVERLKRMPTEGPSLDPKPASPNEETEYLVQFRGPEDPQNPRNWPKKMKWRNLTVISFMALFYGMSSSMVVPALDAIGKDLNITSVVERQLDFSIFFLAGALGPVLWGPLSETYGRSIVLISSHFMFFSFSLGCAFATSGQQLLIFRFLSGIGASSPMNIGGGCLGDMFLPADRGHAMGVFALAVLLGPSAGPLCGAWIVQKSNWRWIFRATAIANISTFGMALWLLKESYGPYILHKRALEIRSGTGIIRWTSIGGDLWDNPFYKRIWDSTVRAFAMSSEPIVLVLASFMATFYGVYNILLGTIPTSFQDVYHQSVGVSGLNYISFGLGFFIGAPAAGKTSDKVYTKLRSRDPENLGKPEYRLPTQFYFSLCAPTGLLIFGWTLEKHAFWLLPNIGLFLVGIGTTAGFQCVTTYSVDTYLKFAVSAVSFITIIRSIVGCLFTLFAPSMFQSLGHGLGSTVLAGILLVCGVPVPGLLWIYGREWRMRSRTCAMAKPSVQNPARGVLDAINPEPERAGKPPHYGLIPRSQKEPPPPSYDGTTVTS